MTVEDRAAYIKKRNEEGGVILHASEQIEMKDKLPMLKLFEEKAPLTDERGCQGKNFFTDGKYGHACYCFWCAVQISPWVVKHWNNAAETALRLHKYPLAEFAASSVLILDPENAKAFFRLGKAKMMQGDLEGADKDLKRAIALSNGNESIHATLRELSSLQSLSAEQLQGWLKSLPRSPPRLEKSELEVLKDELVTICALWEA
ncbi:TPR-like protein [Rickenella mellea]|uniref:TPR-like protein n=1 Tax=Rickenella mellea TaxID=50990 RepID=A0A4Y7PT92_9AGAM|nr:TPR-like protein [Rickenella mellea]